MPNEDIKLYFVKKGAGLPTNFRKRSGFHHNKNIDLCPAKEWF